MKIRLLKILFSIVFLSTSMGAGAVTVQTYLNWKQTIADPYQDNSNQTRLVLKAYLTGVAEGDYAAISYLDYKQNRDHVHKPYSCPPKGLAADHKLAGKMIDAYIAAHPDLDKTVNVAILYVSQMAKTYPCK
ncbi:hypothetical protein [Serratia symbiotica]|uniref:hypothetical protein n=1 Tax=Serratia symbiotica TaxID=138074 RepID=UPI001CF0990C|nr:hypothetical protein [Serratia symbiotica]